MNRRFLKFTALMISALCAVSMASCGNGADENVEPDTSEEVSQFNIIKSTKEDTENTTAEITTGEVADTTESTETTSATTESSESSENDGGSSGITLSYYSAEIIAGQTKEYPVVSEIITEVWTSSDENVATVDSIGNITGIGEGSCMIKVSSADDSGMYAEIAVNVTKPEGVQLVDGLTYIDGILIANKSYSLPADYNPNGLTDATYTAFQELSAGAAADGLNIYISSGFRSYDYQDEIYNNYVSIYGQETADTFSARPGHSEHQTGMAIDVNIIDDSFIGTPEAEWIDAHCNEYGFILRYPQGKQEITGYKYEPWHIRYVGKEVAQAIKEAAEAAGDPYLTLEEYLNIDSKYN